MKSTIKTSDLMYERMENAARAGANIIDHAIVEGRPLTSSEAAQLKLVAIEQPIRRRKWREAVKAEGGTLLKQASEEPSSRCLHVTNTVDGLYTIWLYGVVGADNGGASADDLRQQLLSIPDNAPVEVRIHSEGGDYLDGVAMHSMLASRKGAVHVVIDGLAASAASIIAMAGDSITMAKNAWIMIHEASGTIRGGRAGDFEGAAERLRDVNRNIVEAYLPRWKGTRQELEKSLSAETWFSAEQAVQIGLADFIKDALAVAARVTESQFRNAPAELTIAAKSEVSPRRLKAELKLHRALCVSY